MRTTLALILVINASFAIGETLDIDPGTAVRLALEASDRMTAAAGRADAAGDRVQGADALRMPTIDLEANASHLSPVSEITLPPSIPEIGGLTLFPDIQNTFKAGVVVTQSLWTGGATTGIRQAARHRQEAADSDARRIEVDLRLEARTAYWRAVAATATLEASRAEVVRAERLLDDIRALQAAGMAVKADELGGEARLAAARLTVIRNRSDLANRLAELRSLLGLTADDDIVLVDSGRPLPPPPQPVATLVEEARTHRPELALMTASQNALAMQERIAQAPRRPHLALAGRWDLARPNQRFFPLEDEWNDSWSVGVMASWRVFDGERARSEAAAIDAEVRAAQADRDEMDRQIRLSVVQAHRNLMTALEADTAAEKAVTAAEAREAAVRDRYTAGLATATDVLDAQTDLADAELKRARTASGAWLAAAALDRVLGR